MVMRMQLLPRGRRLQGATPKLVLELEQQFLDRAFTIL